MSKAKPKSRPDSSVVRPGPSEEKASILKEITGLYGMRVEDLRERHRALLPDVNAPGHKDFLIRAIAQKLQEDVFGTVSDMAKGQIEVLKSDLNPLASLGRKLTPAHRLPLPGTMISKTYKGALIEVKVLAKGFEYKGNRIGRFPASRVRLLAFTKAASCFFGCSDDYVRRLHPQIDQ